MIVAHTLAGFPRDKRSVVTVGTFDGVHRGHQEILARVRSVAAQGGTRSVVVTFDPHPRTIVGNPADGPVRILTTIEERERLFRDAAIDVMLVLPFTREFSQLGAEEFIRQVLVDGVGVEHVVVGHDHHFGRGRSGGLPELERQGGLQGFSIERVSPLVRNGVVVSSTSIRTALEEGDVALANDHLGYRYAFAGTVVHGDHRGATLGFPTANLEPLSPEKMLPGHGVYLVTASWEAERRHGMMNIGRRPTVAEGLRLTREAHLFGFEGDLYGKTLRVEFLARLREERKFPSVQELVAQLSRDRESSLSLIGKLEHQS